MLTQAKLKTIKPLAKIARHHDQHGLYLQVMPNGSKYWRLKYHIRNGDKRVEKTLALGVYPEVSLKSARENQIIARQQIRQGIDPSLAKRKERLTREHARANQVLMLARKWFDANIEPIDLINYSNEAEFTNSIHEKFYQISAQNLTIGSSNNLL